MRCCRCVTVTVRLTVSALSALCPLGRPAAAAHQPQRHPTTAMTRTRTGRTTNRGIGIRSSISIIAVMSLVIAASAALPSPLGAAVMMTAGGAQNQSATMAAQSGAAAAAAAPPPQWLRADPAFTALRYLVVDPLTGDDAQCSSVDALTEGAAAALLPCRSIRRAVELVTAPGAWLQLLGGADHRDGDLQVDHSGVIFSLSPPPTLSDADVAAAINGTLTQRMAAGGGSLPVWDCSGCTNCVRSNGTDLQFIGLAFTGAAEHAITQLQGSQSDSTDSDDSAVSPLMPLTIRLSECSFTQIGGMLRQSGGTAHVDNCAMSHAIFHPSVIGLLQLEESSLLLNRSTFTNNHFPAHLPPIRTCVLVIAVHTPIDACIEASTWDSNSALVDFESSWDWTRGGVGLAVEASNLNLLLTGSIFRNNSIRGRVGIRGGAMAVGSASSQLNNVAKVTLLDNEFDGNSIDFLGADTPSSGGACVAIGNQDTKPPDLVVAIERNVFRDSHIRQ
jgi:hypothetical protein